MNLDNTLYQDNDEANGLASRFDLPEPVVPDNELDELSVSSAGIDTESDMGFMEFQSEFAKTLGEFGRGMGVGLTGLPGDIESLGRGLIEMLSKPENQGYLESFIKGMEQDTLIPTSKDIGGVVPHVTDSEPAQKMMGTLGEIAAPVGTAVKGAKMLKGAKPVEAVTTYTDPAAIAKFAEMPLGKKGVQPMSVEGTLHKYVRELAGEPVTKSKALCHSQACQAAFTDAAPGDKLVMLKSPKGDSVAHSILIDQNGNLKFDNMNGKWNAKTRSWEGTPVKGGKPQPMVSAEEYDVSVIRDAAEIYQQNKLMIFSKNEAK